MQLTDKGLRTFNENEEFDVEEFNNKNMLRLDDMLVCNYIADNLTKMNELYPPSATYIGKRCRTKDNNKVYTCLSDGSSYAWINIHDLIEAVKEKLVCQYVADSFSQLNTLYPPSATYLNHKCRVKSDNKVYKCKLVEGTYSWVDDNQGGGGGGGGSWGSITGDIDDQIDLKNKLLGKMDLKEYDGSLPTDESLNKIFYDPLSHDLRVARVQYNVTLTASTDSSKSVNKIGEGPIAERPEASTECEYVYWHATDESKWYSLFLFGPLTMWLEFTNFTETTNFDDIYEASGTYIYVEGDTKTIYVNSGTVRQWVMLTYGEFGMDYKPNLIVLNKDIQPTLNYQSIGNIYVSFDGVYKRVRRIKSNTRLYATNWGHGAGVVEATYVEGLLADRPQPMGGGGIYYATDVDKYYHIEFTQGGFRAPYWAETNMIFIKEVKELNAMFDVGGFYKYQVGSNVDVFYTSAPAEYKVTTLYDVEVLDEVPENRDPNTIYLIKET